MILYRKSALVGLNFQQVHLIDGLGYTRMGITTLIGIALTVVIRDKTESHSRVSPASNKDSGIR